MGLFDAEMEEQPVPQQKEKVQKDMFAEKQAPFEKEEEGKLTENDKTVFDSYDGDN